jgi:hypothetical protein
MKTEAPREATPRPWRASEWSDVVGAAVTAQPDPTKNTLLVASIRYSKADADLIVHAVNAHGALVEALREIAEHDHPGNTLSGYHDLQAIASAALASLTDEEPTNDDNG